MPSLPAFPAAYGTSAPYGAPPSRRIYAYLTGFQGSRYRGGTPSWAQRPFARNADGTPKYRPAWDVMDDPDGTVFAGLMHGCGCATFVPSAASMPLGEGFDPTALIEALTPVVTQAATTTAAAVTQAKQAKQAREAAERDAAHQRKLAKIQAEAAAKAQVAAASKPSQVPALIAVGVLALGTTVLLASFLRKPAAAQVPAAAPVQA